MDYWFKSYDENAYFYAISGTVTPKCIAGVVVSETNGSPRLIADGDVRNEMAATWTAYRRQSNYPDSPWGSGTVNQFWYNSTYDVTWAQIPQTLNRQPYSSNVHLITDISIELVLSKAREYFDHYVPGQGVGEVTIQTDAPSQLLTFTSLKLGIALKYWVRGATLVEFPVSPVESNVKITKFQDQVYEDNEVFGERIAYYTISTTNVTVWFVYTNATLYDMRRILIGNIDRKYSSAYGLNSTAMTMTDVPSSEPPTATFGLYAYDERNISPVITYTTKCVSMEVIGATLLSSNLREWRGGGSLQKMTSLLLQDPGVYIVFGYATIEGDSYGKYAYINDDTNEIILAEERNNCNYGWSSIELCAVIKTTAATTLSVYMNYSASGYYSTGLMAIKLTGFYTKRTFTGVSGTSLAEVCNIAVGAGKYVVVANVTFDTTSACSIYACVENGNNMFMADCGCNTNYYAPIINSRGFVEVPSSGTLSLKVKTSAANIDVSGYLAIVQVE